jgi:hypothetical protein
MSDYLSKTVEDWPTFLMAFLYLFGGFFVDAWLLVNANAAWGCGFVRWRSNRLGRTCGQSAKSDAADHPSCDCSGPIVGLCRGDHASADKSGSGNASKSFAQSDRHERSLLSARWWKRHKARPPGPTEFATQWLTNHYSRSRPSLSSPKSKTNCKTESLTSL